MLDIINRDPIHAVVARHQEIARALDDAAERLLEVHPTTLDGLYTLVTYVNDLISEFGECAFPRVDDQSFASRMLEHVAASLLRLSNADCASLRSHDGLRW